MPTLLHFLPVLLNFDLFQLMTIFEYSALTVVFSHFLNRVLRMAGAKAKPMTMVVVHTSEKVLSKTPRVLSTPGGAQGQWREGTVSDW